MKFRLEVLKKLDEVVKGLSTGLRKLSFADNFDSYEKDLTIPATSTVTTRNNFTFIPSRYIILSQEGGGVITKGTTWDANYISFANAGSSDSIVKIVIMR